MTRLLLCNNARNLSHYEDVFFSLHFDIKIQIHCKFCSTLSYRVCHKFRPTKQDDYFWVTFDHFWIKRHFLKCWIRKKKLSKSFKTNHHNQVKPSCHSPNPWHTLNHWSLKLRFYLLLFYYDKQNINSVTKALIRSILI